jgi:hypothetical protein
MTTNTERDHPWYLAKDEQVPEGMRGVLIVTRRFTDIYEGDIDYRSIDSEMYPLAYFGKWADGGELDETTLGALAALIRQHGLTFAASGGGWAADPDGSRIIDYATGEREEVSAHLYGMTDAESELIEYLVDKGENR